MMTPNTARTCRDRTWKNCPWRTQREWESPYEKRKGCYGKLYQRCERNAPNMSGRKYWMCGSKVKKSIMWCMKCFWWIFLRKSYCRKWHHCWTPHPERNYSVFGRRNWGWRVNLPISPPPPKWRIQKTEVMEISLSTEKTSHSFIAPAYAEIHEEQWGKNLNFYSELTEIRKYSILLEKTSRRLVIPG